MAKKKINKYLYGWKLYVNYGQGWEYETFETTIKGYRENQRLYRQECKYPQKWVRGRELNPEKVNEAINSILGPATVGEAFGAAMMFNGN